MVIVAAAGILKMAPPAQAVTPVTAKTPVIVEIIKSELALQNTGAKKFLCRCFQKTFGIEIFV
jgi:hypothetical protein